MLFVAVQVLADPRASLRPDAQLCGRRVWMERLSDELGLLSRPEGWRTWRRRGRDPVRSMFREARVIRCSQRAAQCAGESHDQQNTNERRSGDRSTN